jgi:hypothetical protein
MKKKKLADKEISKQNTGEFYGRANNQEQGSFLGGKDALTNP